MKHQHLTATPVLFSLIVMIYGCSGGGDVSGKKLSDVGVKCGANDLPIKVSFADTVIPADGSITNDNVCNAALDFAKFITDTNIRNIESLYGPNGNWCDMARKAVGLAGSEGAAKQLLLESAQDKSRSDDEKNGMRFTLQAIYLCNNAEARKKMALNVNAMSSLRLYSVGKIINPANGKACFAYLGEDTYKSNGRIKSNMPSLFAPNCGEKDSLIGSKEEGVSNTSRGNWLKKKFGYTGEMPKTAIFQFNEVPFYSSEGVSTKDISPSRAKPSEKITEAEVRKFLTDEFIKEAASEKKENEKEGQYNENLEEEKSIDKIFIGETALEKYQFAVVQVTTLGPTYSSSRVLLTAKHNGKLRIFNTIDVNGKLESLEVNGQNITINSLQLGDNDPTCCPTEKHKDKYTYLIGDFVTLESVNQDFAKCLPSMPVHVPLIKSLPYDAARKQLLAEGWQPIPQQSSAAVKDLHDLGITLIRARRAQSHT
jgi:hypothetical protein